MTNGNSQPVARLDSVTAEFGALRALDDVSFDIARGEILAVVGANGAGKSTLLNALCGLIPLSGGRIELANKRIDNIPTRRIARAGVTRSFQEPRLIEAENVHSNVMLGMFMSTGYSVASQLLAPWKVRRREAGLVDRAEEILVELGLGGRGEDMPDALSYGERKLVDIARALAGSPTILLLDEPSSGLDRAERAVVESLLLEWGKSGQRTVVMVEHHLDLVGSTAHRVLCLEAGAVMMIGQTDDVLTSEEFGRSLGGAVPDAVRTPTDSAGPIAGRPSTESVGTK